MRFPRLPTMITTVLAATALAACQANDGADTDTSEADPGVVEVTASDFEFEAPAEIPSGWTTFRFINEGEQEHFLYVYRIPDEVTYGQFQQEAMVPFGRVWNQYASGSLDRAEVGASLAAEMPEWYFTDMMPSGGPALTEPGETSQATAHLDPGTYVVECYVKTPQGTWHTERGMQRELTVTAEAGGASAPEADAELTLTNYRIATSGELTAGTRTIAVRVEDTPEGFMMHDINLIRLNEDTDIDEVVAWMDWMDSDGFRAPAPGYSLGGVEHMAAGRTGYMTVDLEPGRYAWVSEGYGSRGMVEEFTIE